MQKFSKLFLGIIIFIIFVITMIMLNPLLIKPNPNLVTMTNIKPAKTIADFNLEDTNKQHFSLQQLKGHWSLIFFGYTDCPDICPMTLSTMRELWNSFSPQQAKPSRFYFASLNPSNDSLDKLKNYLSHFHPEFIGLRGADGEMDRFSRSLGVVTWLETEANPSDSNGPALTKMGHSSMLLLFNPQGRLQGVFSPPFNITDIQQDLDAVIR